MKRDNSKALWSTLACLLIWAVQCSVFISCNSDQGCLYQEREKDWDEIQSVLKNCIGIYEGARTNIETSGFPDGPLLGNGSTGVVGSGTGNRQQFHISNVNFWDGRYTPDSIEETRVKGFDWGTTGVKALAIGGITIYEDSDPDDEKVNASENPLAIQDIIQQQDMLNAEIRTSAAIDIRTWLSATDQILVNELTTKNDRPVTVRVETWSLAPGAGMVEHGSGYPFLDKGENWDDPEYRDYFDYAVASGQKGDTITWVTRQTTVDTTHKFVCRAALATRVFGADVTTGIKGDNTAVVRFTLKPGSVVRVITVLVVVKDAEDHLENALAKVAAMDDPGIDRLHEEHLEWWKDFWLKSYVRMYDKELEKYYFGSLYITACSNRPGNNPSPLHGPWVTTDNPTWKSNYKLSYNMQMTYSGVCSSNRPELLWPYMDIIFDFMPEAQRRSESGYEFNLATGWRWKNPDGSLKFPNGIKGGLLYPLGIGAYGVMSEDSYSGIVSMGAWAAAPCIWYYNATQDETFLADKLYPFLRKLAVFWEAYLVKEDGRWVIKYAGASERYSNDAINASSTIGVVRYLFNNMIPLSTTLGLDQEKRALWQDIVANLSQVPTSQRAGHTVFVESENIPREKAWPGYLMLAYPGMEVTLDSDPELKQIFVASVDHTNPWENFNSPGYFWATAAHGGYPSDSLLARFRDLLDNSMRKNFNTGGSGHGTEGASSLEYINYSMLSSNLGYIWLFPTWPLDHAKFKRLRADGAFLVSASRTDGDIHDVVIFSEKGKRCTVLNPWPGEDLQVLDGKKPVQLTVQDSKYTFNTIPGHCYSLSVKR